MKIQPDVDVSAINRKMSAFGNKSATVKVTPKINAAGLAGQLNSKLSGLKSNAKVTITPKVNTAAVTAKLNSISSRTIPMKQATGSPPLTWRTHTAAVNAQLSSITNRVLQGPRFSPRANLAGINAQLASITNRVIPAPRVARPNMSGVVSAVASGCSPRKWR